MTELEHYILILVESGQAASPHALIKHFKKGGIKQGDVYAALGKLYREGRLEHKIGKRLPCSGNQYRTLFISDLFQTAWFIRDKERRAKWAAERRLKLARKTNQSTFIQPTPTNNQPLERTKA